MWPLVISVVLAVSVNSYVNAVTSEMESRCATLVGDARLPDAASGCCGVESASGDRIVGGTATLIDEHPWAALVEYVRQEQRYLWCGATLINTKHALTAGHCVAGPILRQGAPVAVRAGEYDTGTKGADCVDTPGGGVDCTDGAVSVPIARITPHPRYDPAAELRRHDIAIIRLEDNLPFTDFIRPACLPTVNTKFLREYTRLLVVGWGRLGPNAPLSRIKMQVAVPLRKDNACPLPLDGTQLCAGGEVGRDSCAGDSGGPLMLAAPRGQSTVWMVAGVVSYGPTDCGAVPVAAVYTNVYEYEGWIRAQVALAAAPYAPTYY